MVEQLFVIPLAIWRDDFKVLLVFRGSGSGLNNLPLSNELLASPY